VDQVQQNKNELSMLLFFGILDMYLLIIFTNIN